MILHFIREPNEVRKYNTNVDMSSAIQVNVSSHYATVANGGKVTIGSIASQDTWLSSAKYELHTSTVILHKREHYMFLNLSG